NRQSDFRRRRQLGQRAGRGGAHEGVVFLQALDQPRGGFHAQLLVLRMHAGQRPQADGAQQLIFSFGLGANFRFGGVGNGADLPERERGGGAGVLVVEQGG